MAWAGHEPSVTDYGGDDEAYHDMIALAPLKSSWKKKKKKAGRYSGGLFSNDNNNNGPSVHHTNHHD